MAAQIRGQRFRDYRLPDRHSGAEAEGKRVRDVAWPSGCLIIGLRRGEREIVPRGDTTLRAGDYLVVLFSGEEERKVRLAMRRLCDVGL